MSGFGEHPSPQPRMSVILLVILLIPVFFKAQCHSEGSVIITEILYDSQGTDADHEWVELYNTTTSPIDLNGWYIEDATGNGHNINDTVPLIIEAGGYLVLSRGDTVCGDLSPDYAGFNFALNNTGDAISLFCEGMLIDRVDYAQPGFPDPFGSSLTLMINHFDHFENDTGAYWCISTASCGEIDFGTPGLMNDCLPCDQSNDILINEIHYNPCEYQGSDQDYEFIEILNRGPQSVEVSDWHLRDLSGSIDFYFPEGVAIESGDMILLANNASSYAYTGVTVLQWGTGGGGKLDNEGDRLTLSDCSGQVVADLTYGNADGGGNWPDCADGRCATLSLLDTSLDAPFLYGHDNWGPGKYEAGSFYGSPGSLNVTGCCLILASGGIQCSGTDPEMYTAFLHFADGADDQYFLTSNFGTIEGNDPNASVAGKIIVESVPTGSDLSLEINSAYGCAITVPFPSPESCEVCELELIPVPDCTNENSETYALYVYVDYFNTPSGQFELFINDSLIGLYYYTDAPVHLENLDGDPPQLGVPVEAIDLNSAPRLTITAVNWSQSCGCSSCSDPSFDEYVEITNTGIATDLGGYTIHDDFTMLFGGSRHSFPTGTWIESGETIQVQVKDFIPQACPVFDNSGDIAVLEDPEGNQVSALAYNSTSPSPVTQEAIQPPPVCTATSFYDEPCDPLPLEWIYFEVSATNNGVALLEWAFESRDETSVFLIERSTLNSKFLPIGQISISSHEKTVDYRDIEPLPGRSLYRIASIEHRGERVYSPVRSFELPLETSCAVYPNPTNDMVRIHCRTNTSSGSGTLAIFDWKGQKVLERKVGKNGPIEIDVSWLESGVYLVRTKSCTRRFIKL